MQAGKTPIKKWAKDDRPREKLLSKSPAALSDSELLAILIGTGTPERNAIDLAEKHGRLLHYRVDSGGIGDLAGGHEHRRRHARRPQGGRSGRHGQPAQASRGR